jgi:hypothetical protein
MYTILFTDSMQEKIGRMVEDNYYVDLTSQTGIQYTESLEFTNDHARVMMQISMSMKIMVPIIFHYINSYNLTKDTTYIYQFYKDLFEIYGKDKNIDIYNKLWISTYAKVNVSVTKNRPIWEQREIFGTDPLLYLNVLLKEKIISETMFKYTFDRNIISFNSVVLDKQLGYFIIERYEHTLVELSSKKDIDGLSGLDKLEMNSNKIDESLIILSDINIKKTIKKLKKQIKIDKEEIKYYKRYHKVNKFQVQLVFYFFAKYFGGFRDLNLLTKHQFITLLLILKRRLQIQGAKYLPQILTGNIESKLNTRTIQNTKFLMKIENSSIYQTLINDKFSTLDELNKSNTILNLLSTILNTTFTIVDFDNHDKLDQKLEVNADIVSDEFLNYLNEL